MEFIRFTLQQYFAGYYNTDFNQGNFLFNQRSVTLIDFGSFKKIDIKKNREFLDIFLAICQGDKENLKSALRRSKTFLGKNFDFNHLADQMLESGTYSVWQNDQEIYLPKEVIVDEMKVFFYPFSQYINKRRVHRDFVLGFRTWYGIHLFLSQFKIPINYRQAIEPMLKMIKN